VWDVQTTASGSPPCVCKSRDIYLLLVASSKKTPRVRPLTPLRPFSFLMKNFTVHLNI
jgi:hypothetical protein